MVRALIMNLIPDLQKSEEEKLATGQMPSQYPPMTNQMEKAHREIHHHLTRTTLPMDTSKTTLLPAIRPTCHHQSIRRSKSQREESSYATMMAREDEVVTLDAETIHHDGKPAETADPSEGNDPAMTTVRIAAAINISIAPLATTMTKGRAPAAMTTVHLHEEKREAIIVAEINRRTVRVKDNVILRHPHQAAPMVVAVAVADQQNHATLAKIRRTRSPTTREPT
jgi:predicted amino acid racemase